MCHEAIAKHEKNLGFFKDDTGAEVLEQGRALVTKMRTTRTSGLLLTVLDRDGDKLSRRRACQTALKGNDMLPLRKPLLERAKKAITMT